MVMPILKQVNSTKLLQLSLLTSITEAAGLKSNTPPSSFKQIHDHGPSW